MRFQVLLLPDVPMPELLRRFQSLEELGIEVGSLVDHYVDWLRPRGPWFECWTALAAAAAATTTLRLASCVTQIPLRNPAMLAHQVVTVDHVSGGRIELGLGAGLTADPSYSMMGKPNWTTGERADRFGEYVDLVTRLLSQPVTSFSGEYYSVAESVTSPGPVQRPRPPVLVAAMGPRMLAHAVRHADIWNSLSFQEDFATQLAETRARAETVRELCAGSGRDPASLRWSYTMFDGTARRNQGRIAYYDSQELFVDMVERVAELGVTEFVLYYPTDPDQVRAFEKTATEVLPRLRERHSGQ